MQRNRTRLVVEQKGDLKMEKLQNRNGKTNDDFFSRACSKLFGCGFGNKSKFGNFPDFVDSVCPEFELFRFAGNVYNFV